MVITFENMMRERDFDNLHVQSFFSDLEDFEFKNKRVLELGCGKGNTLIDIKQKFNSNCFGVDLENFVEDKQKDKFSLVEKNLLNISLKISILIFKGIFSFSNLISISSLFTLTHSSSSVNVLESESRALKRKFTVLYQLGLIFL